VAVGSLAAAAFIFQRVVSNLARVELIFTGGALLNFRSLLQSKMVLQLFDKMVTIFLVVEKAVYWLPWPLQ